jgi:hypothetical protein
MENNEAIINNNNGQTHYFVLKNSHVHTKEILRNL